MNHVELMIIAVLQGITELFPISSLGHAVLVPKLLHWGIDEKSDTWLSYLVALHLGTATALLIYFRNDWVDVVRAFIRSIQKGQLAEDHDERLAWMVVVGTIPAGLVGFVLEHPLRNLFNSPYAAASFLILNGVIMYIGERIMQGREPGHPQGRPTPGASRVRRVTAVPARGSNASDVGMYRDITQVGWRDAAVVGFAQVGALFPGISRSGITIVAGMAAGLTHEAAARYAFLLATPIIGAAALLEVPKLFAPAGRHILGDAVVGMILAGIAAYISVRYLMRYFETGRLIPFAYYCVAAGVISLILLAVGA